MRLGRLVVLAVVSVGIASPGCRCSTKENPSAPPAEMPTAAPSRTLTDVAVGAGHSCVLDTSGAVTCWGMNYGGELGVGDTRETLDAVNVPGFGDVVELDVDVASRGQRGGCMRDRRGRSGRVLGAGMDLEGATVPVPRPALRSGRAPRGQDRVMGPPED